jgi:hypothetical protein
MRPLITDQIERQLSVVEPQISDFVPRVVFPEKIGAQEYVEPETLRYDRFDYELEHLEIPEIVGHPRVILIGNAGSGKSYILKKAYTLVAKQFLNSHTGTVPLYYDLNQVASRYGIEGSLRYEFPDLFAQNRRRQTYTLLLDELDKRLISEPNPQDLVNELQYLFKKHTDVIDSVVLACRRPFYHPAWFDDTWEIYHSDTLRRSDYVKIISDEEVLGEFVENARSLGIDKLLDMPIIGFDLARRFLKDEPLPPTRREWFEQKLADMHQAGIRERALPSVSPLAKQRFLAEQLACLSLFGRRSSWTEQEACNRIGESDVIGDAFTFEEVRQLLRSPLFMKSGDDFDFSHQLFAEYLAATTLSKVSPRKQRQLLTSSSAALRGRIALPYRGIAAFLAEVSPGFLDYLLQRDPLVALFAELPMTSSDLDDRLLRSVMDEAISKGRAPWWNVAPRGEMPIQYMHKHRPTDVEAFFRPYLETDNEFALLWATTFLSELGGEKALNPLLLDLARDARLHLEIRKNSIDAIVATKETKSIERLYPLIDSRHDDIRGHVIHAYRVIESPGPSGIVPRFSGGSRQPNYIGSLHREVYRYIRNLDTCLIPDAFKAVMEHYNRLGNLLDLFLRELFRRAEEDEVTDIPPEVVIWRLCDVRGRIDYEQQLRRVVCQGGDLFSRIWHYVFEAIGATPPKIMWTQVDRFLGETCNDVIFDLLPKKDVDLTKDQRNLTRVVLKHYFYRNPTSERLRQFRAEAPAFTGDLRVPRRSVVEFIKQLFLPLRQRILSAIAGYRVVRILYSRTPAVKKTNDLLPLMAKHPVGSHGDLSELEEMVKFIKRLLPPLRRRVLCVLEECVESITYSRTYDASGGSRITHPVLAAPFWILREMGYRLAPHKIEEIATAYAFTNFLSFDVESKDYIQLLEELRDRDPDRWRRCISSLASPRAGSRYSVLRYLADRGDDAYLEPCRQQLSSCDFTDMQFEPLLDYWVALRPDDFAQVLIRCFEETENKEIRRSIMYRLLEEDVDWAWSELKRLIDSGRAPTAASVSSVRSMRLPRNPERLPIIAEWYADLRRRDAERDKVSESGFSKVHPIEDMIRFLNETIVAIGGEGAIRELRRLQIQEAFPNSRWLTYSILRIEDDMLTRAEDPRLAPGALLDFLNKEAFAIVNSERDLFEWVCQAVEDEKSDLEGPGEGVQGYWDQDEPKPETGCQNVLWPKLRLRLDRLNITGVDERTIGPNRIDFWIEKQLDDQGSLRIAIELKTARKGYGSVQLVDPLETQLWEEYLRPTGITHGIYVVFWFKDEERYRYPTKWNTPDELLDALGSRKSEVEDTHGVSLACYVVDVTTPSRKH